MTSTIREGIDIFLQKRTPESPFLIPHWTPALETQIMVHPGHADPDDESESGPWTDGQEIWKNHRWPYRAGSSPYYKDELLTFSPGVHVTRIGSTWWNFETKKSIAVGFDIDVEDGHAESTTTVNEKQLADIVDILKTLPYVTMVRSTGGKGVHVYVFFDPDDLPDADNHHSHTQNSLAVLTKMCADSEYDLTKHIDAKGVITWFWADDSPENHPGFGLIHGGSELLSAADIAVYQTQMSRVTTVKVKGFTDAGFETSSQSTDNGYEIHPVDQTHREILEALEQTGYCFEWIPQHNMAHTHTVALKRVFEDRKNKGLPVEGLFETISQGGDRTKPNCFISTRPNGAFRVARFGIEAAEHPLWETYEGKTWCYFNTPIPSLTVLRRFAGSYDDKSMTFTSKELEAALQAMGETLCENPFSISQPIKVTLKKGGIFQAFFKGEGAYPGWQHNGRGFVRELPILHSPKVHTQSQLDEADKLVRHLISPQNASLGWYLNTGKNWTHYKTYNEVACVVQERFGKDAGSVRAEMTVNPWQIVNEPFTSEYPGERRWNKEAPQLAFDPASEPGAHPHFDMILDHLGHSIDKYVQKTRWCSEWGLQTGGDYLRFWIASIIQYPFSSLPYLFFYGPQDSGKSIFHELMALIFTSGVASASHAIASGGGYNAELGNAVVGYIEERDLSKAQGPAYERIKEWTTAMEIVVHPKGYTPYQQRNALHMIQLGNSPLFLPIEDGDTRVTVLAVGQIQKMIPREIMMKHLLKEAPYFIRTLLSTTFPEPIDRMRVPTISSDAKRDLERINQTSLESFAADTLHYCPGSMVKVADFYDTYVTYCESKNLVSDSLISVSRQLKNRSDVYTIGKGKGNQNYIANVSMLQDSPSGEPLTLNDKDRLVSVDNL